MHDVGPDDPGPDEGGVLVEVGVFQPVDHAGQEVGARDDENGLRGEQGEFDDQMHGLSGMASGGLGADGFQHSGNRAEA